MRATLICLLLITTSARAVADEDDVEAIQRALGGKALPAEKLVPPGFVKAAEARGDLDGDRRAALALLVHRRADENPADEDLHQIILVFRRDRSGSYSLWTIGRSHFIDSMPNFMAKDGVGRFAIKKGILEIATDWAMSMGGWQAGGCTQKWRNGPAGLQLIGLTIVDASRTCACGSATDTNFLTGVQIYTTDRGQDGEPLPRERVTKTKGHRRTILWDAFDYEKMCSPE